MRAILTLSEIAQLEERLILVLFLVFRVDILKMKRCGSCKEIKPLEEYYKSQRSKSGYQSWCKPCKKVADKELYKTSARRRQLQSERNVLATNKNKALLKDLLLKNSCKDCGTSDWRVLEFDHVRDKKKSVSTLVRTTTWPRVLEEIAKCEIVCCNCHRIRTMERGNHWRVGELVDPSGSGPEDL